MINSIMAVLSLIAAVVTASAGIAIAMVIIFYLLCFLSDIISLIYIKIKTRKVSTRKKSLAEINKLAKIRSKLKRILYSIMIHSPKIYVVKMNRWANQENHSYVLGVYTDIQKALDAANYEESERGGKYKAEINEMAINNSSYYRTIISTSRVNCRELCTNNRCNINKVNQELPNVSSSIE